MTKKIELNERTLFQQWSALILMTIGFPIGLIISGPIFWAIYRAIDGKTGSIVQYAIVGAIGGLIGVAGMRSEKVHMNWKSIFLISFAWATGFGLGNSIFFASNERIYRTIERTKFGLEIYRALGGQTQNTILAAIVYSPMGLISGAIGGFALALALWRKHIFTNWKIIPWLSFCWAIGLAIGFALGAAFHHIFFYTLNNQIGNFIGLAIGAAISGVATIWQIRKAKNNVAVN